MNEALWQLLQKAKADAALRRRLWETRQTPDPTLSLCELATEMDCPVTVGEIFAEGEGYLSDLYRSVEGGGTDPRPSWGDVDGLFFAALKGIETKQAQEYIHK